MTVRWTQPASDDFFGIVEWIAAHNPAAAAPIGGGLWEETGMHCWFCESPLRSSGSEQIYCPFAGCPACKEMAPAYALLDGPETERWRRMKQAGTLRRNLLDAGLLEHRFAGDGPP